MTEDIKNLLVRLKICVAYLGEKEQFNWWPSSFLSTGYSYESIIVPYLLGAKSIVIEDPFIRANHQIQNFIRFCEAVLKQPTIKKSN